MMYISISLQTLKTTPASVEIDEITFIFKLVSLKVSLNKKEFLADMYS